MVGERNAAMERSEPSFTQLVYILAPTINLFNGLVEKKHSISRYMGSEINPLYIYSCPHWFEVGKSGHK